jgi:hypothetical protein
MGARNQVGIGLSYRPASLCSLATQFETRFLESIPRPIAGLKFPTLTFSFILADKSLVLLYTGHWTVIRLITNNFSCDRKKWVKAKPEFVNLFRSPGVDSQSGWPVRKPYLTYRNARLADSIPGLLERLQIQAQFCVLFPVCKLR